LQADPHSSEPEINSQARFISGQEKIIPAGYRTYKLTIAYRGTEFYGWQRQLDHASVQGRIEQALEKCWQHPVDLHGSGRTDTGVHALGQVAHFRELPKLQPQNLIPALNYNLPETIRIQKASFAPPSFHSRFSAKGKEYHYRIINQPIADPFQLDHAWHLRLGLDLEAIRECFPLLVGTHDFSSFTSNPGYQRGSMVRKITGIHLRKKSTGITLIFRGEGFLYRMVRNLVGALVKVGHHRLKPANVGEILEARRRSAAPPTAPAHGLYLAKVFYHTVPS